MKKLILISALLFSFNGWTQSNTEIHQSCLAAVDYKGCVNLQEERRKSNCAFIRETYQEYQRGNDISSDFLNRRNDDKEESEMDDETESRMIIAINEVIKDNVKRMNHLENKFSYCF